MAGGGISDILGGLSSGLQALGGNPGSSTGSAGASVPFDTGPQNAQDNVLTDPIVGANAAATAGDPTQQGPQQPPQPPSVPTFQQPQNVTGPAWTPQQPTAAAQQSQAAGVAPTPTGSTALGGWAPTGEATDADLAQAQQEQARKQATGQTAQVADQTAVPAAAQDPNQAAQSTPDVGASSIRAPAGKQAPNPLQVASRALKSIARGIPGPRPPAPERDANGQPGAPTPIEALLGLLTGHDMRDLVRQVGGDYGSQGYSEHGYGYGAEPEGPPPAGETSTPSQSAASSPPTAATDPNLARAAGQPDLPPGSAAAAAPATPGGEDFATWRENQIKQEPSTYELYKQVNSAQQRQMAPGSAAAAIRAGYDGAAAQELPNGARVPTNGLPGGTTPNAPPPSPGFGAVPDQRKRPYHYRTKVSVEGGGTYDGGSGGGQFASAPYGTYYVHPKAIGRIGHRIGAIAGFSDSNNAGDNTVHDPLYRGAGGTHARAGVEIHPVGSNFITNGCIGVSQRQFGAFHRDFNALSARGPMIVVVAPEGISIRSAQPTTRLQEGGIVTQPTVAMIGEAGPEAVVPLSKPAPQVPGQPFSPSLRRLAGEMYGQVPEEGGELPAGGDVEYMAPGFVQQLQPQSKEDMRQKFQRENRFMEQQLNDPITGGYEDEVAPFVTRFKQAAYRPQQVAQLLPGGPRAQGQPGALMDFSDVQQQAEKAGDPMPADQRSPEWQQWRERWMGRSRTPRYPQAPAPEQQGFGAASAPSVGGIAPGGLPWRQWRQSVNVEDASGPAAQTPAAQALRAQEMQTEGGSSLYRQRVATTPQRTQDPLAQALGFNDINLDQLAAQWARQLLSGAQ